MKQYHDILIIGAGIAGLSCARRLADQGLDFLIISKDIGGRIKTSEDGTVNYGAFFVCDDYHHFLKYATIKNRIRLRDFCFHQDNKQYVLFQPKLLLYLDQFINILSKLYRFRRALRHFRKQCETQSQKQVIENDPLLHSLYMQYASAYVGQHNLERGTDAYLSKALYSTTFSIIPEMNAFSFLQFLLPLITPIYTFTFEQEKLIKLFEDKITIGQIDKVHYKNKQYIATTATDTYVAKTLVLATDITWSAPHSHVTHYNTPVTTYMYHVKGKIRPEFRSKRYHLFHPGYEVQAIADLLDGTYLFYYKDPPPILSRYFLKPKILGQHFWDPAGTINGQHLIECFRGNNLYLIGDYNVAGLEETYITGLYAANEIIRSQE